MIGDFDSVASARTTECGRAGVAFELVLGIEIQPPQAIEESSPSMIFVRAPISAPRDFTSNGMSRDLREAVRIGKRGGVEILDGSARVGRMEAFAEVQKELGVVEGPDHHADFGAGDRRAFRTPVERPSENAVTLPLLSKTFGASHRVCNEFTSA